MRDEGQNISSPWRSRGFTCSRENHAVMVLIKWRETSERRVRWAYRRRLGYFSAMWRRHFEKARSRRGPKLTGAPRRLRREAYSMA